MKLNKQEQEQLVGVKICNCPCGNLFSTSVVRGGSISRLMWFFVEKNNQKVDKVVDFPEKLNIENS